MIFDLDAAVRGELDNLLSEMRRQAAAVTLAMEPYIVQLADAGWTIPHHLSIDGPAVFLEAAGADGVDGLFVAHYRRHFRKEFRALRRELITSQHLIRWRPLLEECFAAHARKHYRIAVPSLLLIIEGAVAELVGRPNDRLQVQRTASRWTSNAEPGGWDWFGLRSIQRFLENVFASKKFGATRPIVINRHWVLHGRDSPQWSEADAMRLFHALRTMNMAAGFARRYS